MEKNLGHATAYGYAKSKGYSGTEDEFAQLMADYASVGQSAAQSAEQAAASATSASGSAATAASAAQTATSKASEAVTAAGTATTKASEASTSAGTASTAAQTATDKASEATTAASTATAKASEASESATTATTAKTDAETARDAAAQSASEAAASAESIDPATLEHRAYGAYVVESATGAVASFSDGADSIPMKDVLVHIEPVQEGSGDPSPDNVRPITGWTGAKVTRTGKNLLDANTVWSAFLQPDGTFYHPLGNTLFYIPQELVGKQLTFFSYAKADAQNANLRVCAVINGTNNNGSLINDTTGFSLTKLTFTPTSTSDYIKFENSGINGIYKDVQLELGSTATAYEPYSGQTYDITFPSEAGTVYGGTLDVTKGELVVDRAQIASYNGETLPSTWISDRDVYASGTTPTIGAQVVYKLAEPIHYTITSNQINSLYGQNNLWANTGDAEVEYRADTRLYIEKLTQPEEYDMIADSAINSGQFFMIGNALYRALANIASGATITVGTNAQRVSLSDALNIVNA